MSVPFSWLFFLARGGRSAVSSRQGAVRIEQVAAPIQQGVAPVQQDDEPVRHSTALIRHGAALMRHGAAQIRHGAALVRQISALIRHRTVPMWPQIARVCLRNGKKLSVPFSWSLFLGSDRESNCYRIRLLMLPALEDQCGVLARYSATCSAGIGLAKWYPWAIWHSSDWSMVI